MTEPPQIAATAEIARLYLHMIQHDAGRYVIWSTGAWALIWIAAGRLLAARKIRAERPPVRQLRREFMTSLRTAAIFAASGVVTVLGARAGIMQNYDDPARHGWIWFWISIPLIVLLHDAWFYWTHRLIHDPRLFRRFHRTHHRSNNPSPFTAYSFDVGEAVINAAFLPLVSIVMPLSFPTTAFFMLHMIARNVIGHSGYELFPARRDGRPFFDFMTTVTHHDLHHAQAGWNYGFYFTFWDRLCGTEHPLYHEKFSEAVRKPLDGSAVRALKAAHG